MTGNRKPPGWDVWLDGEYRGFVSRSRFPVRAWRAVRYKYPHTSVAALYVAGSAVMLFFGPVRRWGILLLAVLGIAVVSVVLQEAGKRRRR